MSNTPPIGHGVYARDQSVEWLSRFDFVVLNGERTDAPTKARALVAAGKSVWFYAFPTWWSPDGDDVERVHTMEQLIDSTGARGAIADPERGWPEAGSDRIQHLSNAIRDSVNRGYQWGITSFAEFITRATPLKSSGAWVAPQIYHNSPADNVRLYNMWRNMFGPNMIIPSVALWRLAPDFSGPMSDYAAYLSKLPPAQGAIGWTTAQTIDSMVDTYLSWLPWANKAWNPPPGVFWPWALGAAALGLGAWAWIRKKR